MATNIPSIWLKGIVARDQMGISISTPWYSHTFWCISSITPNHWPNLQTPSSKAPCWMMLLPLFKFSSLTKELPASQCWQSNMLGPWKNHSTIVPKNIKQPAVCSSMINSLLTFRSPNTDNDGRPWCTRPQSSNSSGASPRQRVACCCSPQNCPRDANWRLPLLFWVGSVLETCMWWKLKTILNYDLGDGLSVV